MKKCEMAIDERKIEAEEDLIIDVQFLLQRLLNEKNMSRADLARKAGISKARLTQVLRPEANPTLRTISNLLYALEEKGVFSSTSLFAELKNAQLVCPWQSTLDKEQPISGSGTTTTHKITRNTFDGLYSRQVDLFKRMAANDDVASDNSCEIAA
jgi:DNA-binding phage protein